VFERLVYTHVKDLQIRRVDFYKEVKLGSAILQRSFDICHFVDHTLVHQELRWQLSFTERSQNILDPFKHGTTINPHRSMFWDIPSLHQSISSKAGQSNWGF
jgi:hypothetical protein